MKKFSLKAFVSSVVALTILAAGSAISTFSFAWFSNNNNITQGFTGQTAGAYFARGSGAEKDPYVINRPIHLYNLAWLYYIGFFEGKEPSFSINSDLDMDGFVLPPIGTSTFPFNGHLSGGDKTISNLNISNSFDELKSTKPSTVTEEDWNGKGKYGPTPNILGLFGYISKESEGKGIPSITNVRISNETVKSITDKTLIGVAAGYVDGTLDKIYINDSKVDVKDNTSPLEKLGEENITDVSSYTSVGYCTETYRTKYNRYETTLYEPYVVASTSKDTYTPGGGGTGGDDYGKSIDIYGFYNKMSSTLSSSSNPLTITNDYAIPVRFDSNGTISKGKGKPNAIDSSNTSIQVSSYSSTLPADPNTTNIGYYSGGFSICKNKFSDREFTVDSIQTAGNSPIYWYSTWSEGSKNCLTKSESQEIVDRLVERNEDGRNGDNALYLSGDSAFKGMNANGEAFPTDLTKYSVIKDGEIGKEGTNYYHYKGDIFIPKGGLWVAPIKAGRFEFIATGGGTGRYSSTVLIVRLKRKTPKDYSTGFKNTKPYTVPFNDDWTYDIVGFAVRNGQFCYYGIDISEDDIKNGYEFFITADKDSTPGAIFGRPYIVYLDIGANAGADESTTVTRTKVLELLEQVREAFTYPSGVYIYDLTNAVLDEKTFCIRLGNNYSGTAKIGRKQDKSDITISTNTQNNTGVAYFDPNLTGFSETDLLSGEKTSVQTKRMTYYDYNEKESQVKMFRFSQTKEEGGYGEIVPETQYLATFANNTLSDWKETSGQTVYNDDGTSSNGIPEPLATKGIEIPNDFSTQTNVFRLTTKNGQENFFTNDYLPTIKLNETKKAVTTGYKFTIKNGDNLISKDDYVLTRNNRYSLTINNEVY